MGASPVDAPRSEALAGLVEHVTFHNAENGFCVLRVKVRGHRDLVTVVGHAAMISAGEFVQMSGRWFNDHTHGLQFKAGTLKTSGVFEPSTYSCEVSELASNALLRKIFSAANL